MNKIATQLLANKPALDIEGDIVFLTGLEVSVNRMGEAGKGTVYTLDQLKDFEIYTSPEQLEIDRLNVIIANQNLELTKARMPAATVKVGKKHLIAGEVREIELIFEKFPDKSGIEVGEANNVSQPVISRIKAGTHGKSSQVYKTLILKRNLEGGSDGA